MLGPGAETAVERPWEQAAAREQELEHANVVAGPAAPNRSVSEQRAAAEAEVCPRTGAGQSVDDEAMATLKDADGPSGLGPLNAVNRSFVEPVLTERSEARQSAG